MPNPYGQAGKHALNPWALAAYFDSLPRTAFYEDAIHGRTIRRWKRQAKGVTIEAATRMFLCYDVEVEGYKEFCKELELDPLANNESRR